MSVAEALAAVKARIGAAAVAAGRSPSDVTLVAVSKRQSDDRLRAAYDAGHRDFGENFVQELERKKALLPEDARWHLIGHLQSNKAKRARAAALVHTIDSAKLAERVAASCDPAHPLPILIQVDIDDQPTKAGAAPADVEAIVHSAAAAEGVVPVGLMCIPAPRAGRPAFRALRELRDAVAKSTEIALPHLSMGMSDDFEAAILEGATIVRVGTAIFGERAPANPE